MTTTPATYTRGARGEHVLHLERFEPITSDESVVIAALRRMQDPAPPPALKVPKPKTKHRSLLGWRGAAVRRRAALAT